MQRRIVRQLRLDSRIFNAFAVKLEIDVLVDAHLLDSLDVARTRTVADAVEQVNDLLIRGEAGAGCLRFAVGDDWHDRRKPEHPSDCESEHCQSSPACCEVRLEGALSFSFHNQLPR